MEKKLSLYEQRAFCEISFAIGNDDDDWHTTEDIRGVPIPKKDIPLWMDLLVEKEFYASRKTGDETEYQITRKGVCLFAKLKDKADREAQPVPFRYPKEFKGTKASYF
jgi:predicted transcriptional regulator